MIRIGMLKTHCDNKNLWDVGSGNARMLDEGISHPTFQDPDSVHVVSGFFFDDGGVTARHLRSKVSERNIPKYLSRERVSKIKDPQSLGQQDGATIDKQYCIGENPVHYQFQKASQGIPWGAFFYPYHNHSLYRHEI